MAYQMIVFALCVAGALGSAIPHAAQYPAGVNPHACPNYPYCDNAAVHGAGHHGAVAPYAGPAYAAYGHHGAAVHGAQAAHGAGAKYPAGVDPHLCPNYPYCGPTPAHIPVAAHHAGAWAGNHAGAWNGAHAGSWNGAHAGAWAGHHAGAHGHYDDGSYHGDDGSYHGEDDGSYHHDARWDDGSYHGDGHHW